METEDLLSALSEKSAVHSVERLGKPSDEGVRPVKVVFRSRESRLGMLSKKVRLRATDRFRTVYLLPDRTLEERKEARLGGTVKGKAVGVSWEKFHHSTW